MTDDTDKCIMQNNLAELWALLHFIMPTLFDNMDQFSEWFSKDLENFAEGSQELNKEQLKRLHSILSPFMLRRVKSDVASRPIDSTRVCIISLDGL